jgi:hypothetical protein
MRFKESEMTLICPEEYFLDVTSCILKSLSEMTFHCTGITSCALRASVSDDS